MEVILLEKVKGLGERGKRVQVARGFARNYLIPNRLAVDASCAGEAIFKEELKIRERRDMKQRGAAELVKARLDGLELRLRAQASEEGRLYGSVTRSEIAGALAEAGHEVDRKAIQLEEHIKEVGVYPVEIRLGADVSAEVQVHVEASEA
ncbi:MAG: 50S ribosomal protein L9 [Candidatus Eiseniibacteriota bacterium]|jgi:large subunit ribosomal protein L9